MARFPIVIIWKPASSHPSPPHTFTTSTAKRAGVIPATSSGASSRKTLCPTRGPVPPHPRWLFQGRNRHQPLNHGLRLEGLVGLDQRPGLYQQPGDLHSRALAQVVHIGLVCQAQDGHPLSGQLADRAADQAHHELGLGVVHLAGRSDQRCQLGGRFNQEPRVHADAVPAHTRAGLEDIYTRVAVGDRDRLPYVDAETVGQPGELVGNGYIHVPVGVLHQFDHLGRGSRRQDDLTLHEIGV
jgi:hypothetical protein